ncbi:acetyltransferase (GNAT) family protein [Stackebrandtia albiflava]|uniref:Acetyltransferase (GNAT) family protein n=1 Tax=Stackebrandtia albiflava TaxID=406432 RepID=A0A562UYG6_9ACTN|nr:GNAT family N-acetyltransferase [Stackebrandtia albiflava]TWJ10655.1 acetyltransferase (GNAT) family protein [Stackebrandtia albiflava]
MQISALETPAAPGVLAELADMVVATARHDRDFMPVCPHRLTAMLREPVTEDHSVEVWIARDADRIVGAAWLTRFHIENRDIGVIEVGVSPGDRRRGVGRALLDVLVAAARSHGLTRLVGNGIATIRDGGGAAAGFASATGFTPALTSTIRRLDLRGVDSAAEAAAWDEAVAGSTDYALAGWVGDVPERYVEGVAAIFSIANGEVPSGDMDIEDAAIDVPRWRAEERRMAAEGLGRLAVAAVHRETGELGGLSTVKLPKGTPEHASVGLTIVHPGHRGRRLGLACKIRAHRMLRAEFPSVRYLETGNADVNRHMIAINDRLGFRPHGALHTFQRTW